MLQKYLFIPAIVTILGGLVIWSHNLESKIPLSKLSQKSIELKLNPPRRAMSSIQSTESQELEIEALDPD